MQLTYTTREIAFRAEAAAWLGVELSGPFADLRGLTSLAGAPGRQRDWERRLGEASWGAIGWPAAFGGRDATIAEQIIFGEEYAIAGGPPRLNHVGIELLGPVVLAHGTPQQKQRFLPPIAAGEEIWCQGFSEPGAGSDLAAIRTKAVLDGDEWVIEGQKIWTSLAQFADWAFVLARTEAGTTGRHGLSFLLLPMNQPGVTIRPIRQLTGEAEFNELFLDDARTMAANVLGTAGDGWRVAMDLLGLERGASTLGQQMAFRTELNMVLATARANGAADDPLIRDRLAQAEIGLRLMRIGALRMLDPRTSSARRAAYTYKIQWASWRRSLGELAMDVAGQAGEVVPQRGEEAYALSASAELYLGARADTIYGGTNQIQRNIIAERALGLPREPRGDRKDAS